MKTSKENSYSSTGHCSTENTDLKIQDEYNPKKVNKVERQAPVFVKIDDYKDVLDILDLVKNKVSEAKKTLHEINEMKNQEDSELAIWSRELEEIDRKIDFIDHTLLEPENI